MKPRTLSMQAFGPFANREIVDFTLLPEDSLFLIHGPTGAGKSTLFDGNLTFQRYVLAALLDDVLSQASLRLRAMSRNRYTLQRSQAVADGRRAAGLDLEVLDDYTGRVRPASTLSGGEGFLLRLLLHWVSRMWFRAMRAVSSSTPCSLTKASAVSTPSRSTWP